jgi:hypothetical protein
MEWSAAQLLQYAADSKRGIRLVQQRVHVRCDVFKIHGLPAQHTELLCA